MTIKDAMNALKMNEEEFMDYIRLIFGWAEFLGNKLSSETETEYMREYARIYTIKELRRRGFTDEEIEQACADCESFEADVIKHAKTRLS